MCREYLLGLTYIYWCIVISHLELSLRFLPLSRDLSMHLKSREIHLRINRSVSICRLAIYFEVLISRDIKVSFTIITYVCMNLFVVRLCLYCSLQYWKCLFGGDQDDPGGYVKATASLRARLHFSAEFSLSAAKKRGGLPWWVNLKMFAEEIPSWASKSLWGKECL